MGRKGGLLLSSIISILGSIMMSSSKVVNSFKLFTAGRIVSGFSAGFGSSLLSLYLSEIAPQDMRGFAGGFQEVFIVIGKLIGMLFSLPQFLGNKTLWPYLNGIPILASLVQLCILPFIPESPKYLRATEYGSSKSPSDDVTGLSSRLSVAFYHGVPPKSMHVDNALMEIDKELALISKEISVVQILWHDIFRRSLLVGVMVRLGQEMTGVTAITSFSTAIMKTVGFTSVTSRYNSIGITAVSAATTIAAVFLVERVGRRPLLVWGLIGTCICDLVFMVTAISKEYTGYDWLGYICIAVLYMHVVIFSCGPGPVGWLIIPELAPQVARSTVVSVAVFVNWVGNLLLTAAFLPLNELIHYYRFALFLAAKWEECTLGNWILGLTSQ